MPLTIIIPSRIRAFRVQMNCETQLGEAITKEKASLHVTTRWTSSDDELAPRILNVALGALINLATDPGKLCAHPPCSCLVTEGSSGAPQAEQYCCGACADGAGCDHETCRCMDGERPTG